MPRIIVVTDLRKDHVSPAVLLDEQVSSVHLSTDHASAQLVERVAWAVNDAEFLEGAGDGVPGGAVEQRGTRSAMHPDRQAARLAA